jgi:branched-chain amino acid aminotransferase
VTRFWLDDALVEPERALVPVLDHGFTVGDGVFETLLVRDGVPFALTRHLRRLRRSLDGIGFAGPDDARVRHAVEAVVADAGDDAARARLRITVTSGAGPLGSERGGAASTLVVTLAPAGPWPPTSTLAVVPWPRNERSAVAGLKTTSYAENAVALAEAHRRGADEAVFADTRGHLCEGTGSNVFVVVDGEVVTPSLSTGCLAGITRELVLEWAPAVAPVREAEVPVEVLRTADEVFITSSTRDVHPVSRVDDRDVEPGPVTAEIAAEFARRAGADPDPV